MKKTFEEFKKDFYARIDDPNIFNCSDFNTIKVVLDGLKVNYIQYKRNPDFFFFNWQVYKFLFAIKKIFSWSKKYKHLRIQVEKEIEKSKGKKYFVGYTDRLVDDNNNNKLSIYFTRIISDLNPLNCIFVGDKFITNKGLQYYNLLHSEIVAASLFTEFSKADKELRNELIKTFKRLKNSDIFTAEELKNIKIAFTKFFHQYRIWNYFFKSTNLSNAIITAHYHKEGLVYAAKCNKLKVIELQHGLIADEDIFYVFPKQISSIVHKALFADFILVYGNAWKSILLNGAEYSNDQIKIIGSYQLNLDKKIESSIFDKVLNRKVALLTTQTFMEKYFIDWIANSLRFIPNNFVLIVKIHPNESEINYVNRFKDCDNVIITKVNLDTLLPIIEFNITSYSTTIFDAIRYHKKSFVINFEAYSDYVNSLANKKLVVMVEPNENLFEKLELLNSIVTNDADYYSPYNFNVLKDIIEN